MALACSCLYSKQRIAFICVAFVIFFCQCVTYLDFRRHIASHVASGDEMMIAGMGGDIGNVDVLNFGEHCGNLDVHRHAVIAGLYNTGTNALFNILQKNCRLSPGYELLWQPEWGKHEIPTMAKINSWNEKSKSDGDGEGDGAGIRYDESIAIVIIKDVYTWVKSMCRSNYDFWFETGDWWEHCPKHVHESSLEWIPLNRGGVSNSEENSSNGNFTSLVHVWNAYYSAWIDGIDRSRYPLLIVRFEDLLLRPVALVRRLCRCLGHNELVDATRVAVPSEAAKNHTFIDVKRVSNDRKSAIQKYSDPGYRYSEFEEADLEFIERHANETILRMFSYWPGKRSQLDET